MNKFSRFIQLSRFEKRVLFHALLLLPLAAVAMRIFGFSRVYSYLRQRVYRSFENRKREKPVAQELDPPKREKAWRAELRDAVGPAVTGDGDIARIPLLRGVASGSLPGCVPGEPLIPLESEGLLNSSIEGKAACVARMVRLAAQHGPYRANCLKQSLVIWWLLQRHGVESKLRIGVRKEAAVLEAHAWVECFGQPLNDGPDIQQRFFPFDQILSREVNWT